MNPQKILDIVTNESSRTTNELNNYSPEQVLVHFYARHDQVVKAVVTNSDVKLACHAGCSYCCYFSVDAKPLEVIAIVEYVKKIFSTEQLAGLVEKVKNNINEFKLLDYQTQVATNQACPFLIDNCCSVYEVRPSKCRNNHATDIEFCKACFDHPTDESHTSSYYKPLQLAVNGLTKGFESALEKNKYDISSHEINKAFLSILENPKTKKRYVKRKKIII